MLYIEFVERDPEIPLPADVEYNSDMYFDDMNVDKHLTQFSRDAIRDIDKSTVIDANLIQSDVFGPISPESLSGGVKTLICMRYFPEIRCHLARCGKNVYPWIMRAASEVDVHIVSDYPRYFEGDFECIVENTGKHVTSMSDLWTVYQELCNEGKI